MYIVLKGKNIYIIFIRKKNKQINYTKLKLIKILKG